LVAIATELAIGQWNAMKARQRQFYELSDYFFLGWPKANY
jgi:hypothetical protein